MPWRASRRQRPPAGYLPGAPPQPNVSDAGLSARGGPGTMPAPCPSCPTSPSTSMPGARILAQPLERVRLRSPFFLRSVEPPVAAAEAGG